MKLPKKQHSLKVMPPVAPSPEAEADKEAQAPGTASVPSPQAEAPVAAQQTDVLLSGAHQIEILRSQKELLSLQQQGSQITQRYQSQMTQLGQVVQQKQQAFNQLLSKLASEYGCPADCQFDDDRMRFIKPGSADQKK